MASKYPNKRHRRGQRRKSREYELLQKHSSDLKGAMLHPIEVSNCLQSLRVIDDKTHKKVTKAVKDIDDNASGLLIDAVLAYIKYFPKSKGLTHKFIVILKVFDDYVPLNSVSSRVRREYKGETEGVGLRVGKITELCGLYIIISSCR